VASDLPIEHNIFHARPLADIVDNHVTAALRGFLVHDDTNIFMNFLLQIDAHAAIGSDDFIRAHAGVRRHVPARKEVRTYAGS